MELRRTIQQVADLVGGRVEARALSPQTELPALEVPEAAGPEDLVVLFGPRARDVRTASRCLVVSAGVGERHPEATLIVVDDPEAALDAITGAWGSCDPGPARRHPTAVVDPSAVLAPDVGLGAHCVVGARARLGAGTRLWPGVVIGDDAVVGRDARLHARVVVEAGCRLGDRVIVGAGCVLGADGFGYRQAGGRACKSPQVGTVEIGDDVELGALCTVDRARLGATVIGPRCKLDDHVHVGHNACFGADVLVAGGTLVAGSVTVGAGCLIAGGVGLADGVRLGAGTRVAAFALVLQDTEPGAAVGGAPARDLMAWKREVLSLRRLPDLIARMRSGGRGA